MLEEGIWVKASYRDMSRWTTEYVLCYEWRTKGEVGLGGIHEGMVGGFFEAENAK